MMSDTPQTPEEWISKPTSLKYIPINNQINNIKIILININFKDFKKIYNHEKIKKCTVGWINRHNPSIYITTCGDITRFKSNTTKFEKHAHY